MLLLLSEASGPGGIQAYNRVLLRAAAECAGRAGGTAGALLLRDARPSLSSLGRPGLELLTAEGSRRRFVAHGLALVLRRRPRIVVIGHLNLAPLGLAIRALRPGAAQVYLAHGIEAWARLGRASRWALRQADRLVSVSAFTEGRLLGANGLSTAATARLPPALEPDRVADWEPLAAAPTRSAVPTLLSVSRLETQDAYKGVDRVIEALPRIARAVPDVRYVVVGEGSDRPRLEALARDRGVAERVEFRGSLAPAELGRAYGASWLFVLPSPSEGFGVVFLEAALFAVPALAAADGGAPEVVLDGVTGQLVPPGDVGALAREAGRLLRSPQRLAALGAAARQHALGSYGYDAFRDRYERAVLALR